MIATQQCETADTDLVAAVREGDDDAFEELYRRYQTRIAAFVRGMLRDDARAEDVTQEAFFSALRRMRSTDCEINFKPWIYEIARNAAIDSYRRSSRAEEISMDADTGLRPSDRLRLVGPAAPESTLLAKERLDHLRGAFDELSDVHLRVLVMRELEGYSYREIGEQLDLTRPAVESALFRARRRLESEYEELSEGRRCQKMRAVIGRLAEGMGGGPDEHRLARHARRCHTCRRRARELGLEPLAAPRSLREKVAALLPLPLPWLPTSAQMSAGVGERAAALLAAAAIAGAGGVAIGGSGLMAGDGANELPKLEQREAGGRPDGARPASGERGERIRRGGHAGDGERRARRRAAEDGSAGDGTLDSGSRAPAAGSGGAGSTDAAGGAGGGALPALPDAGAQLPSAPTDQPISVPDVPELSVPEPDQTLEGAPRISVPELPVPDTSTIDSTVEDVTGALPGTP